MVKNWPNDPHLNCLANVNFKDYIKFEMTLVEDNYELIEEFQFFEELKVEDN
jgi:hypothetical protein